MLSSSQEQQVKIEYERLALAYYQDMKASASTVSTWNAILEFQRLHNILGWRIYSMHQFDHSSLMMKGEQLHGLRARRTINERLSDYLAGN